ncbi:S-layer homology domain-containing protein [Sporosarcina sp. JAI121]|uniref:S-layer homology domain-containing protein n=1 Tax=Sporosarcina sp. JAI121 TaxID=2723064 RepID=UPI0015CDE3B5|nr:S-layer homology domain-containing protein [Sporosarcina sp. JAI121]NYF23546.1 hypothetical protein [Sporosarcina sp. JAI121]
MANQPSKYSKFLVGAASAALVASAVAPVASAADFKDTKGNTHEEAINALSDAGVISGYPDGTFLPNKTLTRSDVVKMMGKWLVSEGYKIPSDSKTNPRFSDLTTKSNGELLDYAAVVFDNGVFVGSNGRLLASDNISRENMAVVLVRAFDRVNDIDLATYVAGQEFNKDVKDLGLAKAEARPAIDVLDFFDITNPNVANFNPKGSTTRGHFATFLNNTLNADFSKVTGAVSADVASVKAVNATTVEVAFKDAVENLNSLNFKIDGLTVSNAAVKQSDNKTVVLTTAVQKGGEKYTVTLNEKAIGSFNGISTVIPTSIKLNTTSIQGKVGQQVILSAYVGTKEAGVPVTFNVDNTNDLGKDYVAEAFTNAEGIATYSYTQYVAGAYDSVAVYPTGAPATRDVAQVVWGVDTILAITAVDEKVGNSLSNGDSKLYKVTYNNPETGKPVAGQKVDLSFLENINVSPDQLTTAKINGVNPTQLSNGTTPVTVEVITNSKGEATFSVSGTNASATPVAFIENLATSNNVLDQKELRTTAEKVVFTSEQANHEIKISSKTGQEAATGSTNGRTFQIEVKDKAGKATAGQTVNVAFQENLDRVISTETAADFKVDPTKGVTGTTKQIAVRVDKDGKGEFTIYSDKVNDYATPVAWIDINDSTSLEGNLDEGEATVLAEKTYFANAKIVNGKLAVENSANVVKETFVGTDKASFVFSAANQSGKAVSGQPLSVSYTVKNTGANDVTVQVFGKTDVVVAPGKTATVDRETLTGVNKIEVYSAGNKSTSVSVTANGTTNDTNRVFLGQHTATATFTSTTQVADTFTGAIVAIDTEEKEVTFDGKDAVSYKGASFKNSTGNVIDVDTFEASVLEGVTATYVKDTAGKVSFEIITDGQGNVPDLNNNVTLAELNLAKADTAVSSAAGVVTATPTATGVELTAQGVGTATVTVTDTGAVAGPADDKVATIAVTVTANATTGELSISKTTTPYAADVTAPTATIVSAAYNGVTDTLVLTGTNFTTAAASGDIKALLDWSKIVWDINGDDAVTPNVAFTLAEIASATVTNDTTLTIVLDSAKAITLEGNAAYNLVGPSAADTLDVAAGFIKDAAGNVSTTDAKANAVITITP